jgi:hypothetical protein
MFNLLPRAEQWWLALEQAERRRMSALFLVCLVYIVHYLVYCVPQPFFIEDAGITFAYARHLADGEGLVSYPGGERVEGYSNPLWTFLIAGMYKLYISPWVSSKLLGAVFGLVTLPMVYGLVRRVRASDGIALLAPLMLALSPQFVIWNASGLENSLYVMLLSSGMWRIMREVEDPRLHPVSALLFFLLAMTRPEGVMYAAVAGFARAVFAALDRRWLSLLLWVLVFSVPLGLFHAWRFWYFSWPYPNTYYAKLGTGRAFRPFSWTVKGWKYINGYLGDHGLVYALPLLPLAMAGSKGWRFWSSLVLFLPLCILLLWDGKLDDGPEWWSSVYQIWIEMRVWYILGYAVWLGLANLGRPGWRARSMLWAVGASSVFFVLYAGGDWMKSHRWFNVVEVPLFPILALGLGVFADALPRFRISLPAVLPFSALTGQALVIGAALSAFAGGEIYNSYQFSIRPETSVNDIHRRVRYMKWVQRRLDLDNVTLLDVDMGAHMYYSGWDIVDIAGLIDVPMAQHSNFNRSFIKEYVFGEKNPEFAHCHGGWAKTSRIPKHKEWERYIEIPGYPIGNKRLHIGNHIRKDTFIKEISGEATQKGTSFGSDLRLLKHDLPSPEVAQGGLLYLYTAWWTPGRDSDVQAVVVMTDGEKVFSTASFQPGYRWYPAEDWTDKERIDARLRIPIPKDLPYGKYQLRLAVIDHSTGEVLPSDAPAASPVFLPGELDLGLRFTVAPIGKVRAAAEKDRSAAYAAAAEGRCGRSWRHWKNATRHMLRNTRWQDSEAPEVRSSIASCYVEKAIETDDHDEKVENLLLARDWNHNAEGLLDESAPIAEALDASGQEKALEEDWKGAYADFSLAMKLDPSRSWTRNRAEEARDRRLRITRPKDRESKPAQKPSKPEKPSKTKPSKAKSKPSKAKGKPSKAKTLKPTLPKPSEE